MKKITLYLFVAMVFLFGFIFLKLMTVTEKLITTKDNRFGPNKQKEAIVDPQVIKNKKASLISVPVQIFTLNNGQKMPSIGFGTAGLVDPLSSIEFALKSGYKLIDSASTTGPWYRSEIPIGDLLSRGFMNREDIFITTKLHPLDHGFDNAKASFQKSLNNLKTDYVDLYLIHFPFCWEGICSTNPNGTWQESWKYLEFIFSSGKAKSIGVSNFDINQMSELLKISKIKPAVLQSWFDPLHQSRDLIKFCKENDIHFQAYSSLGTQWVARGVSRNPVLTNPTLMAIASRHNRTVSQIVVRWVLEQGISVIPKSNNKKHIFDNFNVFDITLSRKELDSINRLDGSYKK